MIVGLIYIAIFVLAFMAYGFWVRSREAAHDFTSLKTVTFGDESAVVRQPIRLDRVDRRAVRIVGRLYGLEDHAPARAGPVHGRHRLHLHGHQRRRRRPTTHGSTSGCTSSEQAVDDPPADSQDGFAKDDAVKIAAWRSALVKPQDNDAGGGDEGYRITAIDGQPIEPGKTVRFANGEITMTGRGSLSVKPDTGWQMEPIWLPAPEAVVSRVVEIARDGYKNYTLWEHLGSSLSRVIAGFVIGSIIGIPLGYAMGLSGWFRGWFDPIVEFMRPVPPLALIPLVIIWFGIGEEGKVILLFLAALWIMTIAARAGVSGVSISKVHAAYSLGASKWQILRHVIVPNSLPEIFTGARVAMGVCWGTVVAAELVAADKGAGMMIVNASKFQLTDIVIMGIILIGIIGYGIDILMRMAEKWLVPWKGRG